MIGIKLEGRLGNQLFQYAFIYSTAKKFNTRFYIDKSIEPFLLVKYFNIPNDSFYILDRFFFSIKGYKHFFTHYLKKAFYKLIKLMYRYIYGLKDATFYNDLTPKEELKRLQNKTLYKGFFQSEKYFEDFKDEIKKLFTIKPLYISSYIEVSKNIPSNKTAIVVHLRKGDYINLGFNLPMSYYHKAIKSLTVTNPFFIFISDEPESIVEEFIYLNDIYISRNNEIIDFQFLLNADICILSNSTFSWWGAYLNKSVSEVIVPKYWLNSNGIEFPHSIIHRDWTKL